MQRFLLPCLGLAFVSSVIALHGIVLAAPIDPKVECQLVERLSRKTACEYAVLKSFGWIPSDSQTTQEQTQEYGVCFFHDLETAHEKGYLQLGVPEIFDDPQEIEQFSNKVEQLLETPSSICGFKVKTAVAANNAAIKLTKNERYTFSTKDEFCKFSKKYWKKVGRDSCKPSGTPSAALDCAYIKPCISDCTVGRQVAEMAISYELLGVEIFNSTFRPKELLIGPWDEVQQSKNFVYGTHSGYRFVSEKHFERGPAYFEGLGGYIGNVLGEPSLDHEADRGENFVVVKMSAEAAKSLQQHGGYSYFDRMNKELWEIHRKLRARIDSGWTFSDKDPLFLRGKEILNDPFYTETFLYVHPLGIHDLAFHINRLLRINPRTPYSITIHQGNLNTTIFNRTKESLIKRCMAEPQKN